MSLPPIAALEIGTTKVRVLIGESREDGQIMITGLGEAPSRGIRKAEVVDFDVALSCVRSAIKMAEANGHVTIHQVHLVASGGHIQAMVNRGSVPVIDPSEITREDMEHAMDTARAVCLQQERVPLHTICQRFYIDDQHGVVSPEGMEGSKLSVEMLILHGVRGRLRNTVKVVRSVPMDVQDVAFGGLCSALAVLHPEQKERGSIVIDLGGGTTDFVVYAKNAIALAGSLSVGGDHITNDIATGLRIGSTGQAEKLKEKFGNAMLDISVRRKKVAIPEEVGSSERFVGVYDLNTIVHVRMEETFTMIRDLLDREGLLHMLGAGVVLCGGGSHLENVEKLAGKVFSLPCEVGRPRNVSGLATVTEGPEFAATVGMVRYGFRTAKQGSSPASLRSIWKLIFGGLS